MNGSLLGAASGEHFFCVAQTSFVSHTAKSLICCRPETTSVEIQAQNNNIELLLLSAGSVVYGGDYMQRQTCDSPRLQC